jgi:hypothetical protein
MCYSIIPDLIGSNEPRGLESMIMATAEAHRRAGLAAVTGKHYEGGHWLGSFAVYLVIATRHSTRVSRSIMQFSGLRREIHSASLRPSVA